MNHEKTLRITDLARGGAGVARDEEGRVIFVPFTAPGDQVRVRIVEERRRQYAQAELLEILQPSPDRITPRCPAFGKCGGCQWQHLPYSLQWKTKSGGIQHALSRVQVEMPAAFDELPAEKIWEYRNRIQLRGMGAQIGFFKSGSQDLVPVDRCDIADSRMNNSWEETRKLGTRYSRPYKVEVEVLPSGEIQRTWNARHAAGGFRQVHDEQNNKLQNWVKEQIPEGGVLYDLFGGAGNLSLPLAGRRTEIHCVDLGAPQREPFTLNSDGGKSTQYSFHRAPVLEWILKKAEKSQENSSSNDSGVAILDPPRIGLDRDFGQIAVALEKLGVNRIVAVGCDADAWARDVSRWVKRGWRLERVLTLDLFPQTPHIEAVGVLAL